MSIESKLNAAKEKAHYELRKAKNAAAKVGRWCVDNWEITATVIAAGASVGGNVAKRVRIRREQQLRDLYIYDRRLGCYHKLKRRLRPQDHRNISTRMRHGERMVDILYSMNLLK